MHLGQVWNIGYAGRLVRMRVTAIDEDGQIMLVEVDGGAPWLRALVTSEEGLRAIAEVVELGEDDDPTVDDLRLPVSLIEEED